MSQELKLATLQFTDAVRLLLQQQDTRIEGTFGHGTYVGEGGQTIDTVGESEAEDVIGKLQKINHGNTPVDSRWVYGESSYMARVFDNFEKLKVAAAAGIQNKVIMSMAAGMKRKRDAICIRAFWKDAKSGKEGEVTNTWAAEGANSVVAVNHGGGGGNVGINVAKIKKGLSILLANNVPEEEKKFLPMDSNQNSKLLNEIEVIHGDYRGAIGARIVNGVVKEVLGVEIIHTELMKAAFNLDGNGYLRLPLYTKAAMHRGEWQNLRSDLSQLKEVVGLPWQAYTDQTIGATREDPKRLVEIKCAA